MASSSITSWHTEGGKVEAVTGFIFLGSKITVDGDCSHGIKTSSPWQKSSDQLDSVYNSRGTTLLVKAYGQSYGFSNSHAQKWEVDHKEG